MHFLTIIDLPKTAYRIVERPSAREKFVCLLVLALMAISSALTTAGQQLTKWAIWQNDRYRVAGTIMGVCATAAAEALLLAVFSPLTPAIAAA